MEDFEKPEDRWTTRRHKVSQYSREGDGRLASSACGKHPNESFTLRQPLQLEVKLVICNMWVCSQRSKPRKIMEEKPPPTHTPTLPHSGHQSWWALARNPEGDTADVWV